MAIKRTSRARSFSFTVLFLSVRSPAPSPPNAAQCHPKESCALLIPDNPERAGETTALESKRKSGANPECRYRRGGARAKRIPKTRPAHKDSLGKVFAIPGWPEGRSQD